MKAPYEVYEIANTFTPDLTLEQQIELGINDWKADSAGGAIGFGKTRAEAVNNLMGYEQ